MTPFIDEVLLIICFRFTLAIPLYGYNDNSLIVPADCDPVPKDPWDPVPKNPWEPVTEDPCDPVPKDPWDPVPKDPWDPVSQDPCEPVPEDPWDPVPKDPWVLVPKDPCDPVPKDPCVPVPKDPCDLVPTTTTTCPTTTTTCPTTTTTCPTTTTACPTTTTTCPTTTTTCPTTTTTCPTTTTTCPTTTCPTTEDPCDPKRPPKIKPPIWCEDIPSVSNTNICEDTKYPHPGTWFQDCITSRFYFRLGDTVYVERKDGFYSEWVPSGSADPWMLNTNYKMTWDKNGRWYHLSEDSKLQPPTSFRHFNLPERNSRHSTRFPSDGIWYISGEKLFFENSYAKYELVRAQNFKKIPKHSRHVCPGEWRFKEGTWFSIPQSNVPECRERTTSLERYSIDGPPRAAFLM